MSWKSTALQLWLSCPGSPSACSPAVLWFFPSALMSLLVMGSLWPVCLKTMNLICLHNVVKTRENKMCQACPRVSLSKLGQQSFFLFKVNNLNAFMSSPGNELLQNRERLRFTFSSLGLSQTFQGQDIMQNSKWRAFFNKKNTSSLLVAFTNTSCEKCNQTWILHCSTTCLYKGKFTNGLQKYLLVKTKIFLNIRSYKKQNKSVTILYFYFF